ncbi:DUF2147 domain-containing protein [Dichotomicrobium thermohalophilum]|uniref:Uncharacterized protein (DUF2147 family) n=1 Tax=Dichotomicrobium thermohalophilum TaxID=933063 RepID=A0A397Q603_9HYPH|nr:DUF2147 domain-containing protein [Dichotomicrobium thermohalophilum]RIA56696.1 uncharacterized protein (DUF2147 family) [Dichotomicrobium thermohalophilum]
MRALLPLSLGLFAVSFAAAPARAADAFGVWRHPDNGSLVRTYECGGGLCAKVIKVRDPSRKDVHNPNPDLRSRSIEGIVIMNGARKTDANTWEGQLYNTRDGKTYSGVITLKSPQKLELEGCVLGGLFCKGVTWTRVR